MIWKAYFLLVIISQIYAMFDLGFGRIWEIIDLPISLLSYVALFGFCWKKPILKPIFWKVFLFILIAWNIVYFFFIPLPEKYATAVPQFFLAITMSILYAPILIALYLYAFKIEQDSATKIQKKEIPTGIKTITIIFLLLFGFPFLFQGLTSGVKQSVMHMNQEQKLKIIETPEYKKLNIKTIDDFDKYWAKQLGKIRFNSTSFAVHLIIVFVLLFGLWGLQEWGRLGIIIFSVYKICYKILNFRLQAPIAHIVIDVVFLAFFIWVVVYFTRPKIKECFVHS